jgi:hypothetical protein
MYGLCRHGILPCCSAVDLPEAAESGKMAILRTESGKMPLLL